MPYGKEKYIMPYYSRDIALINFALRRIRDHQYGLCVNCGILIEKALLESFPETPFCAWCIAEIEKAP